MVEKLDGLLGDSSGRHSNLDPMHHGRARRQMQWRISIGIYFLLSDFVPPWVYIVLWLYSLCVFRCNVCLRGNINNLLISKNSKQWELSVFLSGASFPPPENKTPFRDVWRRSAYKILNICLYHTEDKGYSEPARYLCKLSWRHYSCHSLAPSASSPALIAPAYSARADVWLAACTWSR